MFDLPSNSPLIISKTDASNLFNTYSIGFIIEKIICCFEGNLIPFIYVFIFIINNFLDLSYNQNEFV